ncbi:hypothetical protein TNCV_1322291 [Trichonephila clavipes]|nr:hypothetical protein TNCV_1322291 [Trichonephila clavipes]
MPSFGEFRRAKSYCHLYGAQTTGVLLASCHDEFRGPRSDYVRQENLEVKKGEQKVLRRLLKEPEEASQPAILPSTWNYLEVRELTRRKAE